MPLVPVHGNVDTKEGTPNARKHGEDYAINVGGASLDTELNLTIIRKDKIAVCIRIPFAGASLTVAATTPLQRRSRIGRQDKG